MRRFYYGKQVVPLQQEDGSHLRLFRSELVGQGEEGAEKQAGVPREAGSGDGRGHPFEAEAEDRRTGGLGRDLG